ncbi:MAG: very short patch repair endonuclease [Bacteroidales bacterium]
MDVLTKEQRRKNMQAIRSKNTKIESRLAKALFSRGYRYRRNDSTVFGKPDISIKKYKLAIFCDSEFWHGKDWETEKERIKSNKDFWYSKIESNIRRDKEVTTTLTESGWIVLRFWGKEIISDTDLCLEIIQKAISKRKEG